VVIIVAIPVYFKKVSNPWNAARLGEIPAPFGYSRVDAEAGSCAEYLRGLPLKRRGTPVMLYSGEEARFQCLSSGVVDIPLLSNNEQCADVTMRLRAEYLWNSGQYGKITFTDVSGVRRPYKGGDSRKAFENYLKTVYCYCNTSSVYKETKPRDLADIQPGDVLVYPSRRSGTYGHAVLVADVARSRSGKVAVLCVEGNTPARDVHVVRNSNPFRNPWFVLDADDDEIHVSFFRFKKQELRHYQP